MKLYIEVIKLLFNKFILRRNNGIVIKKFSEKMGVVYIKLAQMLATQNFGNLFTENDRQKLLSICDNCNPISYDEIEKALKQEYGTDLENIFSFIEKKPVGSASISQVHRAILKTGEEVAIKIKRKDVTGTIDGDIKRIRKIVHRFGKFVKFSNFTGGDHALNLYLDWILQETDFIHEKENIKKYQKFADNVNGKVSGTKKIKVPKLYEDYCTDNVIVMEFITNPTINKLKLTDENKEKIATALNSYIKSSFWAMFNGKQIVFHGDPHSGNICIDEDGNICFLDMGLICVLSDEDAELCKKFFLTAYSLNYEKLYDILSPYGNMSEEQKKKFKEQCKKYCEEVKTKDISHYFVDLINVCFDCEFDPPDFLFNMAKSFICINGISSFSDNKCSARDLLQDLTVEFLVKRSLNDGKKIVVDSLHILPETFKNITKHGVINTVSKLSTNPKINEDVRSSLNNLKETLGLLRLFYIDEMQANQKN